ncbi:putative ABC transport system substrate-binding protein [Aneurinibacillus soli]|uniref:ABC transporter substrate binding protein n=1 Tax=Aneurinibacillus soli TaxID=1500254 RepID=A0A0U5B1H5_9BACL|nr:ABC transporter substrate-binding protein [Aneurinibacillus soli]PYE62589.1 putative ABC transport system substrate-binding protein [Aneurinibacillus soli]BAU27151.1 ABC transporter substrate binding protein [Aneurinibacillus soli]
MRRAAVVCILFVFAMMMAGCGQGKQAESAPQTSAKSDASKQVKVGITQIVEHPALDSIRKGIIDQLAAEGYKDGTSMQLEYVNAQNDMNNVATIAQKMAADHKDIIIPITTPSAQAVVNQAKDTPVVFSAVTDPVAAKIVPALDKPKANVTGTSDASPMDKQVELVHAFVPKLKNLGVIYNTGEVNASVQVDMIEKAAQAKGIKVVRAGVTNSNEVKPGAESLAGKVDAILIPVDNTVVSSFESLLKAANAAKIPVFASDSDTVKRGAVATYGIDYYKLGKQTGVMAARVLRGEKPGDIPVETLKDVQLIVNAKAAQSFGLSIPEQLKAGAQIIK